MVTQGLNFRMVIHGLDKARLQLQSAKKEVQKTKPIFDKAVIIIEKSEAKTFRLQGRPKWKKNLRGGKTLQKSNRMMQSVTGSAHPDAVRKYGKTTLVFGTKIIYGPSHQFGYPKRGIPERKFLAVYDEDIKMMEKVFAEDMTDRLKVVASG